MKTYAITEASNILGKSYQQTRDLLSRRHILISTPRKVVTEEALKALCEELKIVFKDPTRQELALPPPVPQDPDDQWTPLSGCHRYLPCEYNIDLPEDLKIAVSYGNYPSKLKNSTYFIKPKDLKDVRSWEPAHEKGWREASEALTEAMNKFPDAESVAEAADLASEHYLNLYFARLGADEVALRREVSKLKRDRLWLDRQFGDWKATKKDKEERIEQEYLSRRLKRYQERQKVLERVLKAPWAKVSHLLPPGWDPKP